jgi:hypothetical protein
MDPYQPIQSANGLVKQPMAPSGGQIESENPGDGLGNFCIYQCQELAPEFV